VYPVAAIAAISDHLLAPVEDLADNPVLNTGQSTASKVSEVLPSFDLYITLAVPSRSPANVLVCLTQEAYNKFHPIIRPGRMLVTDTRFVKIHTAVDATLRELPFPLPLWRFPRAPSPSHLSGMTNHISQDSVLRTG
jgi:hypothetical protein